MNLSVKYLIPGMELLEDIKDKELLSGEILDDKKISILKESKIEYVTIKTSSEFDTVNNAVRSLIKSIIESDNIDEMHDLALLITDLVDRAEELKFNLNVYLKDDYNHLENTIILSAILAKKYNEVTEHDLQVDLENTIYASILQDIGRRAKKSETLSFLKENYADDLVEFKRLIPDLDLGIFDNYDSKYHPLYSYFFCKYYKTSDDVKMAVLLHHEKESGENSLINTPLQEKESESYARIARILKLTDLFDIIVRNNVLNNPNNPYVNLGRQIDTIVASSFVNARLTNILKTIVPIYQVGMHVLLSDGTIGVVSENDSNEYNNPAVVDLNGKEIDLQEENITIIKQAN